MADNKQRDPSWQLTRQILVEPWKWKPQQVEAATNLAADEGFRLVPHRNADGKVFWTLEDARAEHDARYQYAPSVLDPHGDPEMPTTEQAEAIEAWKEEMEKGLADLEHSIVRERHEEHGDFRNTFALIAQFWSTYLNCEIYDYEVAAMMNLVKIARISSGNESQPDHWDDIGGYAEIGKILSRREA